ncbi:DNA-3-methyladenine glycosylase family protein [Cumulibacter soli]|uniref:DNA-3-methyladenine glycosylase family protein n=1 Tax=Cumulibacter soli TaxID=2546344 RepID=UPI0010689F2A|nr:hypothetical protein [Cumulibacter soli]
MSIDDEMWDSGRSARVPLSFRLDLPRTLGNFRYGAYDPAYAVDEQGIWRAMGTPSGDVTLCSAVAGSELVVRVWGPGASWALERVEALHGLRDDPTEFQPRDQIIVELHRRFAGVRFARTDAVLESLVPAILSQKITGQEALASWRQLLLRFGSPAPGPRRMRVPPSAAVLRSLSDADWHRIGVDRAHRATVRLAAARAQSLEALSARDACDAAAAMQSIRGIGVWTAAEVAERAWGSADHPSFGDYHIASSVGVALTGAPVDDARMAELLEPYRPHRGRVVRLIELAGIAAARRGPRRTIPNFRDI